ncbi:hypothetical protein ACFY00_11710 [Kitasatospora sp. NPDC001540]|uniref:hypothetical protein n=1 Tax=Kitasatospora sp. NPDC001540 TaxID=3364014 RepID=UPI0036AFD12C
MPTGVPWTADDAVGGPVDSVIAGVRAAFPDLEVRRLRVSHPADDDDLWFLSRPDTPEVQLETGPDRAPPFLVESDADRREPGSVDEAVRILCDWLVG